VERKDDGSIGTTLQQDRVCSARAGNLILPNVKAVDEDKFVAIDIETGAHEMDRDDYAATERLLVRHPNAQIWLLRVGHRAAYRLGRPPGCGEA